MPCFAGLLTLGEELQGQVPPRLKRTRPIHDKQLIRIHLKSKLSFGVVTSLSDTRSRTLKNISAAFPSLAFWADSREIMKYLQEGNLISSPRQSHPHPINN